MKINKDDEIIKFLLKLKWWNWDVRKITDNLEFLTSGNIDELKKGYNFA